MLREQWIFAALMGLVWCGDTLLLIDRGDASLIAIPGSTALAVLAISAWRYPVYSGLIGAVVLCVSTAATVLANAKPYSLGLGSILPTENAAGLLLVLYVFWKRPRLPAASVTAALVLSCLVAIFARSGMSVVYPSLGIGRTLGLGFLQLVLAIGTGMYLRGRQPQTADTPMQALVRRQWPVIAVLSVFLFIEMASSDEKFPGILVVVLGCLVMAGLAVFAPVRPVQAAALGALALALTAVLMRVLSIRHSPVILGSVPFTSVASGMLLVAFATRYAEPRRALSSNAALVASALFALFVIPSSRPPDDPKEFMVPLFMGGLLLVLSVGTGMYFRARDEERATSVQAAVTNAQQAERMALARELHDVVAHHVTGIVVQAQAVQVVAATNPQAATEALDRIVTTGTDALVAMRRLVSSMRGAEPAGASEATEQATTDLESDLTVIVARANRVLPANGHRPGVDLSTEFERRDIPPEVARSALRVVQESLTNAGKHALHATCVQVWVGTNDTTLRIRIADDGSAVRAQPAGGSGGYGLVGMRERIELLGGKFTAGPGEHVGWRVEAWLPLGAQEQEEERR